MAKRKLTEDEIRVTMINLTPMKEEMEYLEKVLLAQKQLAIDTAHIQVREQLKELEAKKRIINAKIEDLKRNIEICEDQIKNGVELKTKNESNI